MKRETPDHPDYLRIQAAVSSAYSTSIWRSLNTEQIKMEDAASGNEAYEAWRESEFTKESDQ